MSYKIVFFDIDGTLYDEQKNVPMSTIKAIEALKEKGIKVAISTGRSNYLSKEIQKITGIETMVNFNGSYVSDGKNIIYKEPVPLEIIEKIDSFSEKHNIGYSMSTVENTYRNRYGYEVMLEVLNEHKVQMYKPIESLNNIEVFGMNMFVNEEEEQELLLPNVPEIAFARWGLKVGDIMMKHINKSIGIEKALQYFEIDKSEAVAFGDGINDIEMLSYVGMGIAMGNGNDIVKKSSNLVTKHVNDNGIEYGLKKIGLI